MKLDQLKGTEESGAPTKLKEKPDPETLEVLKGIMNEMHKTMLTADILMRKLESLLEKY